MSSIVPVQISLPKEVHKRLKITAAQKGTTMRELIVEILASGAKKEGT